MRFALLYPPRPGSTNTVPPQGLLSLASVLEAQGHAVTLEDAALTGLRGRDLAEKLASDSPDMILVSAFSSDIEVLSEELPLIRAASPGARILFGGAHASCRGWHALEDLPDIDAVFLGEAEESLLEYIDDPASRHPGVVTREDPFDAEPRHLEDLSAVPLPAWHLAPPSAYHGLPNGVVHRHHPYAPVITTRGCPYRCTFCAGYRVTGRSIRHRPMEDVWREIDLLVTEYGVREIHIEDDNFTFDAGYAAEFCRIAIGRGYPVNYSTPNGVRLDALDDELLELMKKAGWYIIHCGIESGSDRVLKSIKKGLSTDAIREKVDLVRSHGLPTAGYFILGLPGETLEDMEKTVDFAVSSGLEWAHFAAFLPIPGSEAGDAWFRDHPDHADIWSVFHNTRCPAPPEGVSCADLQRMQRRAFLKFYLRPGPMLRVLGQTLRPRSMGHLLRRFSAYLHTDRIDPNSRRG